MFRPMCSGRGVWGWVATCIVVAFLLPSAVVGRAEDFSLDSVGNRFAFSSKRQNADMYKTDLTLPSTLPWRCFLNENWSVQTRLDFSAGWLTGRSDDAGVFTLGPSFVLHREHFPISLVAGSSPA